jgi:hypothetical protein
MGSIRVVARQLQSIISFYATTEVKVPLTVKIPATVFTLVLTKINSDYGREFIVDLIHIVHHKDVLGRDGAVGLEIKTIVAIGMLEGKQGLIGSSDGALEFHLKNTLGESLVSRNGWCA